MPIFLTLLFFMLFKYYLSLWFRRKLLTAVPLASPAHKTPAAPVEGNMKKASQWQNGCLLRVISLARCGVVCLLTVIVLALFIGASLIGQHYGW